MKSYIFNCGTISISKPMAKGNIDHSITKANPLQTNMVCLQFPRCKVGVTVLTSRAPYSIKCNAHERAWYSAGHPACRTTHVVGFIHCSITNAPLFGAELCPSQSWYIEVLNPSTSGLWQYWDIGSLPKSLA